MTNIKSPLISRTFNLTSVYVYNNATAKVEVIRTEPKPVTTDRPLSAIIARITR